MASPPRPQKKKNASKPTPQGQKTWHWGVAGASLSPHTQSIQARSSAFVVILGGSQDPPPPRSVCLWRDRSSWGGSVAILSLSVAIHPVKRPFCGDRWRFCGDMATFSTILSPTLRQRPQRSVPTIISATKTRGSMAIPSPRSSQHPVRHLNSHHHAPVGTVICTFLSDIQSINHTNPP